MLEPAFLAFGIGDFSRGEDPVHEARIPFDRSLDAGNLDDVNADAENHDSVHFIQILAIDNPLDKKGTLALGKPKSGTRTLGTPNSGIYKRVCVPKVHVPIHFCVPKVHVPIHF